MSLIKNKTKSPGPRAAATAIGTSNVASRMDDDMTSQLGPLFPNEMADVEASRALKIAFFLGVRIGATRAMDLANSEIVTVSGLKTAALIAELKSAGPDESAA